MLLSSRSTPATPGSPAVSASSQKISASVVAAAWRASGRRQAMRVAVAIAGIRSSYMQSPSPLEDHLPASLPKRY